MVENLPSVSSPLPDLDSLWNPVDPAGSEAALQALLPRVERLTGREKHYHIELLALLGRAQGAQRRMLEANATFSEAEKFLQDEPTSDLVSARIRWLLEKGRLMILEKTPSQARSCFVEAWTLAVNSSEDDLAVDLAQMMATIEPPKAQQDWISRAVQIAESSSLTKPKRWLGSLYTAQGWKLYDVRQFEKSLEIFQKALTYLKSVGTDREIFVAKWSVGKVLRAMNRTEEALTHQKALLSELGIGGPRDGRVFEELAECLQNLKRTAEAQPYFGLAYEELSKDEWIKDNAPAQLKRLKDLGKVK